MSPDRDNLRRELRERRRAIPAAQRIAAAEKLAERLLALPAYASIPIAVAPHGRAVPLGVMVSFPPRSS